MPEWMKTLFSILSPVVAVATFYWRISSQRKADEKKRQESHSAEMKELTSTLKSIQDEFSKAISQLTLQHNKDISNVKLDFEKRYQGIFEKVSAMSLKSTKDLQSRIDAFETNFISNVMDRIGKMEGAFGAKMDVLQNTLELMQRHFIENGGK